ncbi:serine/threonine protein phosphatase [Rhizobium sp. B230/85]|uniref:metallophosphoesterase n=1 Tax=unclassified Rhizobium TaxID=2613769 RepID=UPI001ADA77BF|nr:MULTISPECIES: metallophosphoesterase [unclassified Rhizobium]MBO9133582.1 serine/threonine protein phosphatase [Rhizobium sp. B209b/85]QXZ97255.1 serine/threonine protein phosphatase [Rhizobium sp. B230/85]
MRELERPVYAIGDVHGRPDLLRPLLDAIADDAVGENPKIIFLGDIVDRGPDSKEALELIDEAFDRFPGSQLILGNHDEYFLLAMEGLLTDSDAINWLEGNGGRATIESYLPGTRPSVGQFADFISRYYEHHHTLLRHAVSQVVVGDYFLVHAGIRPGITLQAQSTYDIRSIRDDFLLYSGSFEKVIVHGHSITRSGLPEVYPNRIALDTGAFTTNRLTACRISCENTPAFLMTSVNGAEVVVERVSPASATKSSSLVAEARNLSCFPQTPH